MTLRAATWARMKLRYMLAAMMAAVMLSGCVRNEFTVTFTFAKNPGFTPTAKLVYYSADKKKGWMTEQTATGMGDGNRVTGITRLPTVVYVYSETGSTPMAILWAERGDKLSVNAAPKERNGLWSATGNDVTEAVNAWRVAHGNIIRARASKEVNAAIAGYVRAHPEELASAIILLVEYDGNLDPNGLGVLWRTLRIDDDERGALLAAMGRTAGQLTSAAPGVVKTLSLLSRGDTLYTFRAGMGNSGAVLMLWSSGQERREAVRRLRAEMADTADKKRRDMIVLDINMNADTMGWGGMAANDSLPDYVERRWVRLWAPGGEQNRALQPLHLRVAPMTLIEVDANGKVKK